MIDLWFYVLCESATTLTMISSDFISNHFERRCADQSFVQSVFTKLEGVCFDEYPMFKKKMLPLMSRKLLSLHCPVDFVVAPYGFHNLKELCLCDPTFTIISQIRETAKSLERIHLEFHGDWCDDYKDEYKDTEGELARMFEYESLQCLSIRMDTHKGCVHRAIEGAVFPKRPRMRVTLDFEQQSADAVSYLDIVHQKLQESTQDYFVNLTMGRDADQRQRIIRSNQESKRNGCKAQWLYSCCMNR